MMKILPMFPFVAALALLACQGKDGPVADEAVTVPDNALGDASATGLAAPANAATAEAVDAAALPGATDGMGWHYDASRRIASFGPMSGTGAMPAQLTFECRAAGSGRQLVVTRADAPTSGKGTLSFTGNGHVASIAMKAEREGASGSIWRGIASGDEMRAIGRTFGAAPVEANVTGASDLLLTAGPIPARLFTACA